MPRDIDQRQERAAADLESLAAAIRRGEVDSASVSWDRDIGIRMDRVRTRTRPPRARAAHVAVEP